MSNQQQAKKNSPAQRRPQSIRMQACDILVAVTAREAYADKLLDNARAHIPEARDRNLLTELVKGVLRHRRLLDWILQQHCRAKISKLPHAVLASMRTGLYQLKLMDRIPPHAAINEAVNYVRERNGNRLTGMVNAVLRAYNKKPLPALPQDQLTRLAIEHSHPEWLVKRWLDRFGAEECAQLLQSNNLRPPTCLRVNRLRTTRDELLQELSGSNLNARAVEFQPDCIYVDTPGTLEEIAAFAEGRCTVQDAGAASVVLLADPRPGQHVLDLCSAPGGKSVYSAELMQNQGQLTAVDLYKKKLPLVKTAAERLGISIITTLEADARSIQTPEPVDMVLIDAPCSGLGTLQGKPEIKWRRTLSDIEQLAELQLSILQHAATLLKPAGVIVYSTCTTEPEENRAVVDKFLQAHPEFTIDPAENYLPAQICSNAALQTLPHKHACDGTFAIRLKRT